MKYKLLKDHPYAKAGTVVKRTGATDSSIQIMIHNGSGCVHNIPMTKKSEWLEEVPACNNEAYWLDESLDIYSSTTWDWNDGSEGEVDLNLFHTRDEAEEACRRVKETLKKFHEELGS